MSATALSAVGNDRIRPGGNLSRFDVIVGEIDAYYDEAKNWASDGFTIENQEQADEIDTLDKALLKSQQEADELREAEKKPHDDASDAVQAKFNPYVQKGKGKTYVARASLKALLTAWRVEQQRIKDAEARRIREEAEAAERAAQQAFAQTNVADIGEREEAERLATRATDLAKEANRATRAATVGTGLRTYWETTATDPRELAGHYWKTRSAEVDAFFLGLAKADVHSGVRSIPGCSITEQKKAN